jgi:hypothetical protein
MKVSEQSNARTLGCQTCYNNNIYEAVLLSREKFFCFDCLHKRLPQKIPTFSFLFNCQDSVITAIV